MRTFKDLSEHRGGMTAMLDELVVSFGKRYMVQAGRHSYRWAPVTARSRRCGGSTPNWCNTATRTRPAAHGEPTQNVVAAVAARLPSLRDHRDREMIRMVDSAQAEQPAEHPAAADPSTLDTVDPLKDRFRAALERKRRTDAAQSGRGHGVGNNKVHEARRAGGKRAFRRKSG